MSAMEYSRGERVFNGRLECLELVKGDVFVVHVAVIDFFRRDS
jgi:hypothetical protein